jgi:hypothetical protein
MSLKGGGGSRIRPLHDLYKYAHDFLFYGHIELDMFIS